MPRPSISLKARALRYLSMREHSRLELARKLSRYAQEGDDVEGLLDWLEGARFLCQQRFSESLIHRRSARFGNNRIVSELHSHGIQGDDLGKVKAGLQSDEAQRARAVLLKKFSEPVADAAGRAKQMRFLQQRGFSHGAIRSAMSNRIDDSEDDMASTSYGRRVNSERVIDTDAEIDENIDQDAERDIEDDAGSKYCSDTFIDPD